MPRMRWRTAWLTICLAAIGVIALAGWAIARRRRERLGASESTPSAEAVAPAPPSVGGDVQPATTEVKRRRSREDWDVVDEASDESFPASDTPAY